MIIIDTHEHFFDVENLDEIKDLLIESNKKYNIYGSLVSFSINERDDSPKQNNSFYKALNYTLKFCKEKPNFKMLIRFLPKHMKNYKNLDNFITKNKKYIKGLKMHPWASDITIDDPKCFPFIKLAEKHNLPILVHTALDFNSQISHLEHACNLFPNVNFIAAHLELESDNKNAIETLARTSNLYGDLAWVNPNNLLYAKKLNVMNKIMFGTDNPIDGLDTLNNPYYADYFKNSIKLSKKEFEGIMYKNALKIYNLTLEEFKKQKE